MATFKSFVLRWMFAIAVFLGSFVSFGAAFAPYSPPHHAFSGTERLNLFSDPRTLSGTALTRSLSRQDAALDRLGELVLTHRAIAVSA